MCEFLSGLTFGPKLEGKFGKHYSDPKKTDSHSELEEALGLKDRHDDPAWAKWEFSPKGKVEDFDNYSFRLDENREPSWWTEEIQAETIRFALSVLPTVVYANGAHEVRDGRVHASDSSQVTAYGSSQVTAYGSSQVTAYGSSQVKAFDSSQVTASGSSQVTAFDSSQVTAYDSSQVKAFGSSQVRASGSSQVTASDSSQVTAYCSSQVTAYDSSQVTAYGSSQVTAYGSSQVKAFDSSQVTASGSSTVVKWWPLVKCTLEAYALLVDRSGGKEPIIATAAKEGE